MQISKRLYFFCAATLVALPLTLCAADNAAQSKARQALDQMSNGGSVPAVQQAPQRVAEDSPAIAKARDAVRKKWAEIDAQSAQAQPNAATADTQTVEQTREALRKKMAELESQPAQAAPAVVASPVVPERPVSSQGSLQSSKWKSDPEKIAKAREALHKAMAGQDAEQPNAPVISRVVPAPVAAMQAPSSGQAVSRFDNISTTETDSAKTEQLRQALSRTMASSPVSQPVVKQVTTATGQTLQYKPLPAPPAPFSSDKQARLDELLRKYRADEISPDEYHVERAKIIAQP